MLLSTPKRKLLITGASGLLGSNLAFYFRDKYDVVGLYNHHPLDIDGIHTAPCNLLNYDDIVETLFRYSPSIIIHCAAFTDMDECERNKTKARDVNVSATANIVNSIRNRGVRLIYISTDAVYDGLKGYFSEKASARPQNFYGLSKLSGELEALKTLDSLILRTNIFGWNIQNKVSLGEWVLGQLTLNKPFPGFTDAIFSPIYTFSLARIIEISIQKNLNGTYNCASSDSCSKYAFARRMAVVFGFDPELVTPLSIDNSHFRARRAKDLSLDVTKLEAALEHKLPTISDSIDCFHKHYMSGLPARIRQFSAKGR